jgi:hypothetical protein
MPSWMLLLLVTAAMVSVATSSAATVVVDAMDSSAVAADLHENMHIHHNMKSVERSASSSAVRDNRCRHVFTLLIHLPHTFSLSFLFDSTLFLVIRHRVALYIAWMFYFMTWTNVKMSPTFTVGATFLDFLIAKPSDCNKAKRSIPVTIANHTAANFGPITIRCFTFSTIESFAFRATPFAVRVPPDDCVKANDGAF